MTDQPKRPRITISRLRPGHQPKDSRSALGTKPRSRSKRRPDLEAFCLSIEGRLKKMAYLTASRTDLGVRALRNTGTPLELLVATGRAEIVEYEVFLEEKHQVIGGATKT